MTSRLMLLALLGGCAASSRVVVPPPGEHPQPVEQWTTVETPPPPVSVEEIGPQPTPAHRWIDGQWAYQPVGQRWVWEQGKWCLPPPGAVFYARPRLTRERRTLTGDDTNQTMRVIRWNELLQRYEKVDLQSDVWRWMKGRFYARGADGKITPAPDPRCVEPQ